MYPGRGDEGVRQNRRWLAFGVAPTLAVALAVLIAVPNASAGPSAHPVVLSAPYHGTKTGYSNTWSVTGCAHASIATPAFFAPKTGLAGFADRSSSPTCNQNPLGAYSSASSEVVVDFPVKATSSSLTIVAVTSVDAALRAHLANQACASSAPSYSCYAYASASVTGDVYLYDQTSGNYWFPSTFWYGAYVYAYDSDYCSAGTCSSYVAPNNSTHLSTTVVWTIPATGLVPTDSFVLVAYFSSSVSTEESNSAAPQSTGSATAVVDAATGSHGIDLASITIV